MKVFVFSKKTGIIYGLMLVCLTMLIIAGRGNSLMASNSERDLPIYCVDKGEEKIVSMSFDAAWGNEDTEELIKMGARITVQNSVAVVEGVGMLHSAVTQAADLRGGVALVTAALAAEGETTVRNIHHIDRGCENLSEMFTSLGGKVAREKDTEKRSEDD